MENFNRINVNINGKTYAIKNYSLNEENELLTVDVAFCEPEYKCSCCGFVGNKKDDFIKDRCLNIYACKHCVDSGCHDIAVCQHCGEIAIGEKFNNDFGYCPDCMDQSKKKWKQEKNMRNNL